MTLLRKAVGTSTCHTAERLATARCEIAMYGTSLFARNLRALGSLCLPDSNEVLSQRMGMCGSVGMKEHGAPLTVLRACAGTPEGKDSTAGALRPTCVVFLSPDLAPRPWQRVGTH